MASKAIYIAVAAAGIGAASGAAWWWQNKPAKPAGEAAAAPLAPTGSAAAASGAGGAGGGAQRAPAVEVARVEALKLTDDAQAVGSLRSRQGVMIRPEVSGRVTQLNFRDGDRVRRGQLLVQLDDQLPVAQLKQAEAELSIARANHKRNQELLAQNFISAQRVDESAANLQVAEAKLALARATVQRLRILAPFDGITGIRSVNVGDYLKDGADVVNVEDMEALFVDFRLPERFQVKLRKGQAALVDVDALPGRRFQAQVQAVDPLVDANGRSVGVRACIDNRQLLLRPGMFARVTAVFGQRDDAKVIPEEALVPQGGRVFVYKLIDGPDQDTRTAQRIEVKTGIRQPGRVEVVQGLNVGDMVVTAGQQRIQRDGMAVRVLDAGKGGAVVASSNAGGAPRSTSAAAAVVPSPEGRNPCGTSLADATATGSPEGTKGGGARPSAPRPEDAKAGNGSGSARRASAPRPAGA
ncbi:efflux RND transporter periplasmic adaptor subunit [Ramlibacter albus]|uniref:Efflux RND transporter periplasmic adaptor subunit n=1 Tax=Ramlibacter albus TaxID=2079448 RepID=A0A923MBZ2_9BURK|nr:efflux RND transporter periplasmic adaptor subunit [Ramlibacter albus]MBC5766584.1 efflux RND transporter periplasmic adaptor subunit [Ramlibacter albus]